MRHRHGTRGSPFYKLLQSRQGIVSAKDGRFGSGVHEKRSQTLISCLSDQSDELSNIHLSSCVDWNGPCVGTPEIADLRRFLEGIVIMGTGEENKPFTDISIYFGLREHGVTGYH